MDHLEIEWQFDAVHLQLVERWLRTVHPADLVLTPGVAAGIIDLYLDTQDWRLFRAGYSLRIRSAGGRVQATMKALKPAKGAMRRRREISADLQAAAPEAVLRLRGPLADNLRALAGRAPLRRLFEVRTLRQTFALARDGQPVGEVALDETTIPVGEDSPAELRRVEVEVPEQAVEAARPFVELLRIACGLQPAMVSKFEAGLIASGLRPDTTLDVGPVRIDADMSAGEVAFAVLRRQFRALIAKEPGTRLGDDPEDLHDMRVATRRLRAAIALFEPALPVRLARLREEVGWLGGVLGSVRDLDVQLEQLGEWTAERQEQERHALDALRDVIERSLSRARAELLRTLDSGRYARFVMTFSRLLRAGPLRRGAATRTPITVAAPELVRRRYRAVRRAGAHLVRDSPPADFHRLRIRCKRLRYALEFVQDVYPGDADHLIAALVDVQDILGAHQDAIVAMEHLRSLLEEHAAALPPATIFAMGEVAQRYTADAASLRGRLPGAYASIKGKAWKDFRRDTARAMAEHAHPSRPGFVSAPDGRGDDEPAMEYPTEPGVEAGTAGHVEDGGGEVNLPAPNLAGNG
jgi:triphosphatase